MTISTGGTFTAPNATATTLQGTITNNGTIAVNAAGSLTDLALSGNVTLAGTGSVVLSNNVDNRILGSVGTEQLTNDITIQGSGTVGGGLMSLINKGLILANQSNALFILPNSGGATNQGVFQVNSGSTLSVIGTNSLTNFSGTTLTGGTCNIFSGTFQFTGANIATNAATILLDGSTSRIIDQSSNNALANFATNAAAGNFTIQDGRNLTTATTGNFTNAGR